MKTNQLIRLMQQHFYEEKKAVFMSLGHGGHYTDSQKKYAFDMIQEYGIRATSRILSVPRRTLKRWFRRYSIYVKRCPDWVFEWAERRRKRKEYWQRRGLLLNENVAT